MLEYLKKLLQGALEFYGRMTVRQRIILGSVLLLVLVLVVVVPITTTRVGWEPLYEKISGLRGP